MRGGIAVLPSCACSLPIAGAMLGMVDVPQWRDVYALAHAVQICMENQLIPCSSALSMEKIWGERVKERASQVPGGLAAEKHLCPNTPATLAARELEHL